MIVSFVYKKTLVLYLKICNCFLLYQGEFLPAMKERNSGHIINITSDSERVPFAGVSVYTGSARDIG